GLHQMRVALRRLRAAVSLFADMLLGPQTEEMKTQFKWITQELGPARELDVFIKRVVRPVTDGKPNGPGMAVLAKDLQRRREEAFARAHTAIESNRFRGLVLDTAGWIEAGDWTRSTDDPTRLLREQPTAPAAAAELRRRWKKVLKAGAQLDELEPPRRHKMRIQAKKLRYASEFFAGAFPGKKAMRRRKEFVAGLEKLQDALGDLNDITVHEGLSERSGRAASRRHLLPVVFLAVRRRASHPCSRMQSVPTAPSLRRSHFRRACDLRLPFPAHFPI